MKEYRRNVQTNKNDKAKQKKKKDKNLHYKTPSGRQTDRGSPNKQNPCHVMLRGLASTRAFVF